MMLLLYASYYTQYYTNFRDKSKHFFFYGLDAILVTVYRRSSKEKDDYGKKSVIKDSTETNHKWNIPPACRHKYNLSGNHEQVPA